MNTEWIKWWAAATGLVAVGYAVGRLVINGVTTAYNEASAEPARKEEQK